MSSTGEEQVAIEARAEAAKLVAAASEEDLRVALCQYAARSERARRPTGESAESGRDDDTQTQTTRAEARDGELRPAEDSPGGYAGAASMPGGSLRAIDRVFGRTRYLVYTGG